jgi:hypothetical protein
MRRARAALLALTAASCVPAWVPVVRAEEPAQPPACVVPAFVPADDAGLWATYDGVRRGLEEASLPRVCRYPLPEGEDDWEAALAPARAAGTPLVFAVGREAALRCARALRAMPEETRPLCVYVDTTLVGDAGALPADPDVPLPAAVVRAEVPLRRWRSLVEALLPPAGAAGSARRPRLFLPPATEGGTSDGTVEGLVSEALGADLVPEAEAQALLDWQTLGRRVSPAAAARKPVLSSDRGRFGTDACALVVPDHARLGRVAADAGRRLLRDGEGRRSPLRIAVATSEVWIDLDACDRAGFAPPLRYLAGADRLRRGPSRQAGTTSASADGAAPPGSAARDAPR